MPPNPRDISCLWDMLQHVKIAQQICSGLTYSAYQQNKTIQLAVERALEITGEAARNISEEFQQAHPEIPWRGLIAQRNVLAHEYGEIRQERFWVSLTAHLPALAAALVALNLPSPPADPETPPQTS